MRRQRCQRSTQGKAAENNPYLQAENHESGYGFQGAAVGGKYSFGAATIYSPSPREGTKQVLPTPQRAPALPTHLGGGGVWPKVLDGIQWTMTEHSLASRLEAVCVYGVGEWGSGGCAVQ